MNLAHLHLLLNHFPAIGAMIAISLLIGALLRRNEELKIASLVIFFGLALISLPAYMSGAAAVEVMRDARELSDAAVKAHQDGALWGLICIEITGIVAWFALWQYRRNATMAGWTMPIMLILSLLSFATMARTANTGGLINHPEIQSPDAAAAQIDESAEPLWMTTSIASFTLNNPWVWPIGETAHFLGLSLLFGIVLPVNLRVIGFGKAISFASLHRFLPLAMLGFVINAVSGMLFFIATPEQYTTNVSYYAKVVFIMLAGVNALYFTLFDEPWRIRSGDDAPARSKVVAFSSIIIWVAVIYFGRMLPYIGNSL
jgi:hypothetical protein